MNNKSNIVVIIIVTVVILLMGLAVLRMYKINYSNNIKNTKEINGSKLCVSSKEEAEKLLKEKITLGDDFSISFDKEEENLFYFTYSYTSGEKNNSMPLISTYSVNKNDCEIINTNQISVYGGVYEKK